MSRFGATVGQFVLLASLRAQVSPGRDGEFKDIPTKRYVLQYLGCFHLVGQCLVDAYRGLMSNQNPVLELTSRRAFADFCTASIVLHLFCFNFLG
jgi:oligosaccharyltransferase complex subunit epsilon